MRLAMQTETSISPRELHQLMAQGRATELLDVRTPGEFAAAHVPGTRLIPLHQLNCAEFLKQRGDVAKTVYIFCHSGARARKALENFHRAGFHDCLVVEGGTQAWMDAGLPIERSESRTLPLMRQVQLTVGAISAAGAALALAVNPWFALIPLVMGCGLTIAGITGFCGLAVLLAKMPWNNGPLVAKTCNAPLNS